MLADVFENIRNMRLKIYGLHPARFLLVSRLVWKAALKKVKVKLDIFNWYQYVINGRKMYKRWNISLYLSIC